MKFTAIFHYVLGFTTVPYIHNLFLKGMLFIPEKGVLVVKILIYSFELLQL